MEIVGNENADGVHTIDVWFSARRDCWVLERHDPSGDVVGVAYRTPDESDASACLAEWLRAHAEVHLIGRAAEMVAEARGRAVWHRDRSGPPLALVPARAAGARLRVLGGSPC